MSARLSNFQKGFIAAPVSLAAFGVAAAALFGGWTAYEKWSEGRRIRLRDVKMPSTHTTPMGFSMTTLADLGGRDVIASLVLTAKKVDLFRVTNDTGVVLVRAARGTEMTQAEHLRKALNDAIMAVHTANEAEAKEN